MNWNIWQLYRILLTYDKEILSITRDQNDYTLIIRYVSPYNSECISGDTIKLAPGKE